MKIVAVSIWVFINLTVLGLFAYVYMLWTQYWKMTASSRKYYVFHPRSNSTKWLASEITSWHGALINPHGKVKHFWDTELENKQIPTDKLETRIETYKNQLIVQLRQAQMDSGNVLYGKEKSRYSVNYQGFKNPHKRPSSKQLLCALRQRAKLMFLNSEAEPFHSLGLGNYLPDPPNGVREDFNTCAIVSSAGSLYKSNLGKEIDAHDAVLRFNSAPTEGFEDDVGRKTTFRIINSQVISKPQFDFFHSHLYRNVTLMVWDPANYTVNMTAWFYHPEFNVFEPYFKFRRLHHNQAFYIFHPQSIWDLWDFIQSNTAVAVLRNPPSSGFLGLAFLLQHCNWVRIYEYIPSMRLTKRCHYFDVQDDLGCTFGLWHPLASEKLLTLAMNSGTDVNVFHQGFVLLEGFPRQRCKQKG